MAGVFGPMMNLTLPERVIKDHLQKWMDYYLVQAEVEDPNFTARQVQRPMSWVRTNRLQTLPGEDATPAILMVARGSTEKPKKKGGGLYDINMFCGVAAVTGSADRDYARDMAGLYGIAISSIMLHRGTFDHALADDANPEGRLVVTEWGAVRLDDLIPDGERSMSMVRCEFTVQLKNVLDKRAGDHSLDAPPEDPTIPHPGRPQVEHIEVEVEPKEIT